MKHKILTLASILVIITFASQQLAWACPAGDLRRAIVDGKRGTLRPLSSQERSVAAGERGKEWLGEGERT